MIYNNSDELTQSEFEINVELDQQNIIKLSRFIWNEYVQILVDDLDKDYDYNFEEYDEPYPKSKTTISDNPLLIDEYFKKSVLWRDYAMEKFFFPWKEGVPFDYYIIGYKGAYMSNENLVLSYYAVEKK
jgi:hypothetical protein